MVANVSGKVDGETNAHDEVDQGNPIQAYPPPSHVPDDAHDDRDNDDGDPNGAHEIGDENDGNEDHDAGSDQNGLDGLWSNGQVLVNVDEPGMEDHNL